MNNESYIEECINIARKGVYAALPNPCVGALVVHNGKIIGAGCTEPFGGRHAEVVAIDNVADKSLLSTSTLYVTMEPCCHHGKTPPCTDLILASGIKKVVVGAMDPFLEVNGKGIQKLQEHGVEVTLPVKPESCRFANRRFYTFHESKRPYVILKWAQTKDGFLDKTRNANEVGVNWISGQESKIVTHTWRSNEMAIAVGTNTVRFDNPSLTTREVDGKSPLRIVVDRKNALSLDLNVFNDDSPTLIFNEQVSKKQDNLEWIKVDFTEFVDAILDELYQRNIMSVIIEGGKQFLESFIQLEMWDEVRQIVGPGNFGNGLSAPDFEREMYISKSFDVGADVTHISVKNPEYEAGLNYVIDLKEL